MRPLVAVAGLVVGAGAGWWLTRWLRRAAYRLEEERQLPRRAAGWVLPVTALLWMSVTWRFWDPPGWAYLPVAAYVVTAGVALAAVDADVHRLPEAITLPSYGAVAGLLVVASAVTGDWGALLRALVCGLVSAVVYFLLFLLAALVSPGGLGFGDVVLSGIIGMALGWLAVDTALTAVFAGFIAAGLGALLLVVTGRGSRQTRIAFGPYMLLGALLVMLSPTRLLLS